MKRNSDHLNSCPPDHHSYTASRRAGRIARSLLLIVVLISTLVLPSFAPSQAAPQQIQTEPTPDAGLLTPATAPGDEFWATGFGSPGTNSSVSALAVGPDGQIYAGGYFTTAGGIAVNRIARWDGVQWHPLGSGTDGFVNVLAVGPDGSLYAGGGFEIAGGVVANSIARWDGSQWHPLAVCRREMVEAGCRW